jgi:hypothetical protein
MSAKIQAVSIKQDHEGLFYVMPIDKSHNFYAALVFAIRNKDLDSFYEDYGKYQIDGDLDECGIQFFAEI